MAVLYTLRPAGLPGRLAEPRTEGRLPQAGRLYCTALNLRLKSSWGVCKSFAWLKIACIWVLYPLLTLLNICFISPPPHISSSVKVLRIRVPMAKHSFRDNCSIVLFIPYYVLLTSTTMRPCLQPSITTDGSDPSTDGPRAWRAAHPPMGRPSADGRPVSGSTDGSDPSTDGSDRPMARNRYTRYMFLFRHAYL